MLGDVIVLSVVVKDREAAIKDFETLYGLKVSDRRESKEYGYINAILPLGKGYIELMQPTDPSKALGRFLKNRGEGVYMVAFEVDDVPANVKKLREKGVRVTVGSPPRNPLDRISWVHPKDAHGVFIELKDLKVPEGSILLDQIDLIP